MPEIYRGNQPWMASMISGPARFTLWMILIFTPFFTQATIREAHRAK